MVQLITTITLLITGLLTSEKPESQTYTQTSQSAVETTFEPKKLTEMDTQTNVCTFESNTNQRKENEKETI